MTHNLIGEQIMHDSKGRDTRQGDQHPSEPIERGFKPKPTEQDRNGNPLPANPPPEKP